MKINHINKKLSITLSFFLLASSFLYAEETKETDTLDSITVIEDGKTNYLTSEKLEISRSNIKLEDTPKSIQVFNQEFIQDYQAQSLSDIIMMSSNSAYIGDNHGRANNYVFRGFSGVPILRDGLNLNGAITNAEMYNIQRIEVLKGPDSIQFGESNPGGLINLVKKKSKKEDYGEISIEVTSNNSLYPKFDIGGSVNQDGSIRYRLVSSYQNAKSTKDYNVKTKKIFLAPSLAYDINDNHTVTFLAEYLDKTSPADWGGYLNTQSALVAPRETVFTHPDAKFEENQKIIGFDFDSSFDTWSSSIKYRYVDYSRDNASINSTRGYNEATHSFSSNFSSQKSDSKEHVTQFTLNKEFLLADMKNNLSFGIDFSKSDSILKGDYDTSITYLLDLNNISYSPITYLSDHPNAFQYVNQQTDIKKTGFFIQDSLNLSEKLIISAGLRYEKSDIQRNNILTSSTKKYKSDASTPQLGLLYKINPETSIYTNYSKSFKPQVTFKTQYADLNGDLLDPEKGTGYEIGIKQKFFNDKLRLNAAIFKIEKTNVAIAAPEYTRMNPVYIASSLQKSKGFELDLTGNISKNVSLLFSYGYTKTKDLDNDNKELTGVPKHTANIFTTYNITPSIYIGAGARFIGSRYVNSTNTLKLNADTIYNATIAYKKDQWRINLSIKNLTNKVYVEGASTSSVSIGEPRTVLANISYSF